MRKTAAGAAGFLAGLILTPACTALPSAASAPSRVAAAATLPNLIAYVRGGDLYVSNGPAEKRLTTGGGYGRPRWSPDGKRLAVLKNGQLWTMKADGTGQRRLTTRAAAGPSWSPDGRWIAFASLSCTGGPGVYRIAVPGSSAAPVSAKPASAKPASAKPASAKPASAKPASAKPASAKPASAKPASAKPVSAVPASGVPASAKPEVLFPRDCRGEDLPDEPAPQTATGSLTDRLRTDDAVAWSPDGRQIAFRGGVCDAVYDACLSIGTISSGEERTVAAYGGGSLQNRGFAVIPAWRPDGARLSFTAYQEGETTAQNEPLHVVEFDPRTGTKRTIGIPMDRELTYLDATRALLTAQTKSGSQVTIVNLKTGSRTLFHSGSQPAVQPR